MVPLNMEVALNKYNHSLNGGSVEDTEKTKYNLLWECSSFFELVINYIALNKFGIRYNFGKGILSKGQKLYRIRDYISNTDFSNPGEWTAPPKKPQNRANTEGQEALYLRSTETICLLETHKKKCDTYVLGMYEVTEDIELGGYLSYSSNNELHNMAGIILNAFLIAPSRSDRNKELFSYLDSYYGVLTLNDFANINELNENGGLVLPMKFGVLNQNEQYYKLTNQLCSILYKDTSDGIRYSSSYLPLETVGIECSDYNIVLYSEGISKVKFIDHKIKINEQNFDYTDLLKIIIEKEFKS